MSANGADPRLALAAILQKAHAGELAAYLAYEGHWRSLRDPEEAAEVRAIGHEELVHRDGLRAMLDELGCPPAPVRENLFRLIGTSIAAFCRIGGWLAPMYGAGWLERGNIREYEVAAELAWTVGRHEWVEPLLAMAEVEWEHERYFRAKVSSHWMSPLIPLWGAPEAKETIRRRAQSRESSSSMR